MRLMAFRDEIYIYLILNEIQMNFIFCFFPFCKRIQSVKQLL